MKKAIKMFLILMILITYAIDIFLIYFFSLVLAIWEESHTQPGLTEQINVFHYHVYWIVSIIVFIILTVIVVLIIRREKKKALENLGSREVQTAVIRKYNVIVCVTIVIIFFLFFCSHMLLRGIR